jgi:hypothetical protein
LIRPLIGAFSWSGGDLLKLHSVPEGKWCLSVEEIDSTFELAVLEVRMTSDTEAPNMLPTIFFYVLDDTWSIDPNDIPEKDRIRLTDSAFEDLRQKTSFAIVNTWAEEGENYAEVIASFDQDDEDYTFDHVKRSIQGYFSKIFMQGDCWDMALALHRNFGLRLGAVKSDVPPDEEESIYSDITHVFAITDEGHRVDIRGVFASDETFLAYSKAGEPARFDNITPDQVVEACEDFARLGYIEPAAFNDPTKYAKAALADELCELLFSNVFERPFLMVEPGM